MLDRRLERLETPRPNSPADLSSSGFRSSNYDTGNVNLLTKHVSLKAAEEAGEDGCNFMKYLAPGREPQEPGSSQSLGLVEMEDDWYLKMYLNIGEIEDDYYSSVSAIFEAPRELEGQDRFKYLSPSSTLHVYTARGKTCICSGLCVVLSPRGIA